MTLHDLKLRIQSLIFPRRVEQELDEELAFHIERDAQRSHRQRPEPRGRSCPGAGALRPGGARR